MHKVKASRNTRQFTLVTAEPFVNYCQLKDM